MDVGNYAYSLGRYRESAGQPVLMSGYLGSIGIRYPAALGAWAAAPGRPILSVSGDGGFGLNRAELLTSVKYCIRVDTCVQLDAALAELVSTTGPALLCVQQDAQLL